MTNSLMISNSLPKPAVKQGHWPLYLVVGLLANAAIWSSALLYLSKQQPVYNSTLSVTLPGSESAANVNLPNIGQASYQSSSPYAIATQDPRENYKILAESEAVLKEAATKLNMPLEEFGKPKIKIIPNTGVMMFDFKGASPEKARSKSFALYNALEVTLNKLRTQEIAQKNMSLQSALVFSQNKLEAAQARLSDYKARSGLSSNEQLNDLSSNIEELRRKRAEILGQQQQMSARLGQLSTNLKLSAGEATDAFVLQADQLFQQHLKDYNDASTSLVVLGSKFTPDHPTVISEKARQNAAQTALMSQSQSVLGRPVNQATIQQFNLSSTSSAAAREKLFQEVVVVQADRQGFQAQGQEINRQIAQLEARLRTMAQQESVLDALTRNVQIAEAVFSSTLAKLDLGRSNDYGSYPLIQMFGEPSLANTSSSPNKKFVLLGVALGSLFLNTGFVSLWLRRRKTWIPEQKLDESPEYHKKELGYPETNVERPSFNGIASALNTRLGMNAKENTKQL